MKARSRMEYRIEEAGPRTRETTSAPQFKTTEIDPPAICISDFDSRQRHNDGQRRHCLNTQPIRPSLFATNVTAAKSSNQTRESGPNDVVRTEAAVSLSRTCANRRLVTPTR